MRELLYLDCAVERVARMAVERAPKDMSLEDQLTLVGLVAENLCLSLHTQGEELVYCIRMWRRVQAMHSRDREWALLAKSVLERMSFVVSTHADQFNVLMQPTAEQLGAACGCDEWTIKLFSEEVRTAASGRGTGLGSLVREGVSTPSAPLGHCITYGMMHRAGLCRWCEEAPALRCRC